MTSIEWLEKNIRLDMNSFELIKYFDQAKEMHKKEIIDAYNDSWHERFNPYKTAEKYYEETFKKD
jgi:hypothetical protein